MSPWWPCRGSSTNRVTGRRWAPVRHTPAAAALLHDGLTHAWPSDLVGRAARLCHRRGPVLGTCPLGGAPGYTGASGPVAVVPRVTPSTATSTGDTASGMGWAWPHSVHTSASPRSPWATCRSRACALAAAAASVAAAASPSLVPWAPPGRPAAAGGPGTWPGQGTALAPAPPAQAAGTPRPCPRGLPGCHAWPSPGLA